VILSQGGGDISRQPNRPEYISFGKNGFILRITKTQLNKSTINANKIVRKALIEAVDYSHISPGEKILIPCKIHARGKSTLTQASCLIPKRRGETSPEPRIWPYNLNSHVNEGALLWFVVRNGELEIFDYEPN